MLILVSGHLEKYKSCFLNSKLEWLLVENLALEEDKCIISKYPMFNVLLSETDVCISSKLY